MGEAKNHWTKNIKFNFTTNMAPKVKLTYFNLRGRAEPTRMLLAYGGIEYEDCRVTPGFVDPTEWMALKPKTPYGSLPLLEWNGECLAQSMAIARFVAKEVGLAGRCNMECAQDDEKIKKFMTETIPNTLAQLEKRLSGRGGQYFVGNAFSWADLMLYNFCSGLPDQSCLDKVPKIKNLMSRVANIPNIKCWVEKRPATKM